MSAPGFLHLDLDAFYASVEQRERPELRGRPVVVGGLGGRGVVAAASYEAREHGIHSAMPMAQARRRCPDAAFVAPRPGLYAAVSREVMAILMEATPRIEPLSLDEAFLDISGAARLLGGATEIGTMLRTRIRGELGLTASVGAATTKMLAKIASDLAKPDGLLVVEPGTELEVLHPLPVRRLWGVGPATQRKLVQYGVATIGDLARLPEATLVSALGPTSGTHLHRLAWNRDERSVDPDREVKSISHEETFAADRIDRAELLRHLARMAENVARRVRAEGRRARTVQLKVRYADFTTITRARTLAQPTDATEELAEAALDLLATVDLGDGVRLLGVGASGFEDGLDDCDSGEQLALDLDRPPDAGAPAPSRERALEESIDAVRDRFGVDALGRAAHLVDGRVRSARRGSLWGPDVGGG